MRTIRHSRRAVLVCLGMATFLSPSYAHSLKDVEKQLYDTEKYFQPVDSETPDFSLEDADGRVFRLSDFRSKVVVLNFIYTFCPDVCPLHADRIAEIQSMINLTPMKDQVQFVTITTDPKRDTGRILRDYGAAHGLDPVNWVFLTSGADLPPDTTRKIAEAYGLKFVKTEDGLQMHGVVTHVIDQDSRLRARFHGLGFKPVNLVVFVNALVNRAQAPHQDTEPSFWGKLKELL